MLTCIWEDDKLIYIFHLVLNSPIKLSISYITCSHIIELKLEIKLKYLLHLNRLLNFLSPNRRASSIEHPKVANSQYPKGGDCRIIISHAGYKPERPHMLSIT